ncbi:glycosyltransferase family 2 protein [Plantibacter sp. VKM Ac-2885]|uniref:glycosyltransferase family 2 protein n=1 Tax=Plantibacter sp. VKM Ac-2885 TaxID=2783828 RepID=UPI00188C2AA3|nr:glycosyltransferase family 2 protein [Plantibacter sp. VKM Ac-2885]MBF4513970.1 glycosyltransferase family 2 protein [Plantibacter sp. VKM Ac-2885]
MLAFITTLRHPQNSVDYGRVEQLLQDTLRSVTQQTVEDYVVIIVGNQRPSFDLPARTKFVLVDFPAPAPPTGAQTARAPFVWDKGTKLGVGLIAAMPFDPSHVMIFDADDFVHRDLAAMVSEHLNHPGWVIRDGWMYSQARNAYIRQPDFNRTCGTCFIVPFEAYGVPEHLTEEASQQDIAEAYGERLSQIMGAHRNAESWYREHGRALEPLSYPGAVYHVDTGENHSGKSLTGFARPLDTRMERDFAIAPSRGRASTLWSAFGPIAVFDEVRRLGSRVVRRFTRALKR